MVSCVDQVLGMTINGDEGEEVIFADTGIPSPYLQVTHTSLLALLRLCVYGRVFTWVDVWVENVGASASQYGLNI
jgi:hypothetical protein